MRFTPNSAADIALKSKPITGNFPGRVHSAEDCTSKKGVDMIKLGITVYVNGKEFQRECYLHPAMEVLVYNFCKNANLEREYQNGELRAELCENKDVMVRLGIEKGDPGYQDKSVIKDFLPLNTPETKMGGSTPAPVPRAGAPRPSPTTAPDPADDSSDVPF